jgi:Tol biopolymer transport system component
MPISPGTRLGPYEIVAPLGAGAMGEVWRARDPKLDREAALKFLPPSFAEDSERLARFEREAKVLAALNHPNIAGIYGFHEHQGLRFLAMELVPGEELAERLKRGPMPLDDALDAARQIADALEAAHEQGIVHRDLKPANIKLAPDGKLKVLDFGLAKALETAVASGPGRDAAASPTITSLGTVAGVILGTAAYMSPEQARGKSVDKRSDIWSFGCVLYEMLNGKLAFDGDTISDTMAAVLTRDPDWSALPSTTPKRLVDLLKRCVRKDPRERLRDIGDARIELAEIAKGGAEPDAGASATAAPRRSVWPVALAALVLGGLATAAVMRSLTKTTPPETLRVMVQAPDKQILSPQTPDFTMSPDGSTIAFVASDESGMAHVWLRSLGSEQTRVVAGTEGASFPFWSPDGRHLGFCADRKIKRVGTDGEGLQVLCAAPALRGAAWGAQGTIVYAPSADGPIMMVPAAGGEPTPVTTLDKAAGETGHRLPSFLPDGRHFLYAALPEVPDGHRTKVGSIDGKPGTTLLTAKSVAIYARPGYLVYLGDGSVFARPFDAGTLKISGTPRPIADLDLSTGGYAAAAPLTVADDGTIVQRVSTLVTERMEIFDRQGKSLGRLPAPDGDFQGRALSPDGKQLVLTYQKPGDNTTPLYMLDLARGIFSRFTFDAEFDQAAMWTPDGRRVIYGSDRPGGRNFYWKNADGSGGEELLADVPGPFNDGNAVTPDGRLLVYTSYGGDTGEDLWIVDLDGKHEARPLLNTKANEMDATVSPDGRWIAYRSDESGEMELYAQSFPTLGHKVRLTINGAFSDIQKGPVVTRWRNDGREILFFSPDGRTVMSIPVTLGAELTSGAPVPLFKLPPEVDIATPSPDGQKFYACVANQTFSRGLIRLVRNWATALGEAK